MLRMPSRCVFDHAAILEILISVLFSLSLLLLYSYWLQLLTAPDDGSYGGEYEPPIHGK